MRNIFRTICILLCFLAAVGITGCEGVSVSQADTAADDEMRTILSDDDPKHPSLSEAAMLEDYYAIEEIMDEYGDILWFESIEDAICVVDQDYQVIWQGLFSDDEVMEHEDVYYLKRELVESIVTAAQQTAAERQRLYTIGEAVRLGGSQKNPILLTVDQVTVDEDGSCVIYYSTQNYPGGQYAPQLFERVETSDGIRCDDFFSENSGSISIRIPNDQMLQKIILCGEDPGLYRVITLPGQS